MPWIKQVDAEAAAGELKDVYDQIITTRGKLSNIMKIQSMNPEALKSHLDLYLSIMFKNSGLKREEKELIAVVVSALNKCEYCINHHAEALNQYWRDKIKLQNVINDFKSVELPVSTFAVLSYAEKLTLSPELVSEMDIKNLRIHNFSDENILNINLIISYFNFVNRIAVGLGVIVSEDEVKGYKY